MINKRPRRHESTRLEATGLKHLDGTCASNLPNLHTIPGSPNTDGHPIILPTESTNPILSYYSVDAPAFQPGIIASKILFFGWGSNLRNTTSATNESGYSVLDEPTDSKYTRSAELRQSYNTIRAVEVDPDLTLSLTKTHSFAYDFLLHSAMHKNASSKWNVTVTNV